MHALPLQWPCLFIVDQVLIMDLVIRWLCCCQAVGYRKWLAGNHLSLSAYLSVQKQWNKPFSFLVWPFFTAPICSVWSIWTRVLLSFDYYNFFDSSQVNSFCSVAVFIYFYLNCTHFLFPFIVVRLILYCTLTGAERGLWELCATMDCVVYFISWCCLLSHGGFS